MKQDWGDIWSILPSLSVNTRWLGLYLLVTLSLLLWQDAHILKEKEFVSANGFRVIVYHYRQDGPAGAWGGCLVMLQQTGIWELGLTPETDITFKEPRTYVLRLNSVSSGSTTYPNNAVSPGLSVEMHTGMVSNHNIVTFTRGTVTTTTIEVRPSSHWTVEGGHIYPSLVKWPRSFWSN